MGELDEVDEAIGESDAERDGDANADAETDDDIDDEASTDVENARVADSDAATDRLTDCVGDREAATELLAVSLAVGDALPVELLVVLSDGELEIVVLSLAVWLLVALKLIDTLVVEDAVTDEVRVIESPVVGVGEADADADGVLLDDSEPLAVFEALTDGEIEREAGTVALTDGEAATEAVAVAEAVCEADNVREGEVLAVGVRLRPAVGEALDEMLGEGVRDAVMVRDAEALAEPDTEADCEGDAVGEPTLTKMKNVTGNAPAKRALPGCFTVMTHTAGANVATVNWSVTQAEELEEYVTGSVELAAQASVIVVPTLTL